METDFFDGLSEAFTRTARELGERAEQIYEIQRIRNKILSEERIVDKLMEDMGKLLYRRYKAGEMMDEEICSFCSEIDKHYLKIKEYKRDTANVKGKKICPSCGRAADKEVAFCPYCGAVCPDPNPEKTQEPDTAECECDKSQENTD